MHHADLPKRSVRGPFLGLAMSRAHCLTAGLPALALIGAASAFRVYPRADIAISGLFYSPEAGFALRATPWGQMARSFFIAITDGTMLVLLALLLASLVWPALRRLPQRAMGFAVLTYLAIPVVLVNAVIKPFWGRARPSRITEFGGDLGFSVPFQISDQCHKACGFISGETSALFTCATLFCLLVLPHLRPSLRGIAVLGVAVLAVTGSGLRIAFGSHFLSDVVFAAALSVMLVVIAHGQAAPWLRGKGPKIGTDPETSPIA